MIQKWEENFYTVSVNWSNFGYHTSRHLSMRPISYEVFLYNQRNVVALVVILKCWCEDMYRKRER